MADVLIRVDGVDMPNPSKMKWGLQDVSIGDSGRDDTGYMYKGRVTQKRKLELEWTAVSPSVASTILQAFNPEYINVRYFDPMENSWQIKNFYVGDRSGNVKIWSVNQKIYESISFDIIER
jgi:hypothetical protein